MEHERCRDDQPSKPSQDPNGDWLVFYRGYTTDRFTESYMKRLRSLTTLELFRTAHVNILIQCYFRASINTR